MAITWALHATPNNGGSGQVNRLIWVPELALFVGVLSSGTNRVVTSPDGVTWTFQTASQTNSWRSVAWSPALSLLVAVASSGTNRVMTSPDGVTWTNRTAAEANSWHDVVWAASLARFVAVSNDGTNRVMTSPDGTTWTARAASSAKSWQAIAWAPSLSLFVATAGTSGTASVMTSPDGTTWTDRATPVTTSFRPRGIAWSPTLSLFVACSGGSHLLTSADGTTWADWSGLPSGWGSANNNQVIWAPELARFVVTPGNNAAVVLTSPDGVTWTTESVTDSRTWDALAYAPALASVVLLEQLGDSGGIEVSVGVGAAPPEILAVVPATGGTLGADPVRVIVKQLVTGATVTFDGTPATSVAFVALAPTTIASSTIALATVITTTTPHGLATGDVVTIDGHTGATPAVAGDYPILKLSPTKFSVPLEVTVAGSGGTVTPVAYLTGLIPAHAIGAVDVVVTNPDSTTDTLANGFTYTNLTTTPIVNAGQTTIATGPAPSTVPTDGSATRGLNNGTLTYAWTQVSGPAAATISDPAALTPDLTFDTYVPGAYVFELAATSEGGVFTTTSQVTVVLAPTVPPRVTSGGALVAA